MKRKFTKLLAAIALLVFMTPSLVAWGQTRADITLTAESGFLSSYSTNHSFIFSSIGFADNGVCYNAKNTPQNYNIAAQQLIQMRKSGSGAGEIHNTDPINTITSIVVTLVTADKSFTINYGTTSELGSTIESSTITPTQGSFSYTNQNNGTSTATSYTYTFDLSGYNATYFKIVNGSAASYVGSIVINYSASSTPVDPTITFNNGSVNVGKTLDLSTLFTSNSSGAVNYSITAGGSYATLSGSTLTGVDVGSVTVKASQEAAGSYNAGEATATITVNAAPALSSIAITTPPTKTTYTEGETFDATGMVVTATYSDASTDDVTASCTWTPNGALTTSDTEITVSYTENSITKTATQAITVNAYVQPTNFDINLNDNFFGTNYGGSAAGITDEDPVSGIKDNVTVTYAGSGNHYINASQIRLYPNNKLKFEAPSGYVIKSIVFTEDGQWNATISADCGSYTDKTWTGSDASVLFTGSGSGHCRISKATITIDVPAPEYNITYATGLTNGAFAAGNPTSASAATTVTVATTPDAGYRLATMTYSYGENSYDATVSGNSASFTMPESGVLVSATFVENTAIFTEGIYSETLTTQASFDTWKTYSVTGEQVWAFGGSTYGAKISGHVGDDDYENEDWLISPKMQIANGKLDISFDCVGRYGEDGMATIWYSTNYTGSGDPTSASVTWTEITPDPAIPYAATNWNFQTITGSIEATGNVYFAIKYVSTTTNAGTLEVKNFTAKQYYTITLSATNGTLTSSPADKAVVGATVTLTATPTTNYHFVSWSVNPSSVTIVNDATNDPIIYGTFTMPAENVTVSPVFEADVFYYLGYWENGELRNSMYVKSGPIGSNYMTTPVTSIADIDFVGWATTAIAAYTETAPELIDDQYIISGETNLYAVYKYDYSYNTGGAPATWTKVTDASTLAVGDQLVIASDAQGKVAGEIASSVMGEVDATFVNSVMESLPSDAVVLTLGGTSGAWTLANSSNQLLGATALKKLAWGNGTTTWNIVIDANGEASISNGTSSYGKFLHNVTNTRFTTYTSDPNASMLVPQLYRLEGGTTPVSGSYYFSRVSDKGATQSITESLVWPGNNIVHAAINIDGATLTVEGLLICPAADNILIENGGQLIAKGKGVKATVWKDIDGYSGAGGWNLIASPLAENTTPTAANGFLVGDYDLYYHDEATSYWMNYENSSFNIQPNKGYLYATDETTGTILEFAGVINPSNENITISGLTNTSAVGVAAGYNLIGNPFTCTAYLSDGRSFYRMNGAGDDIVLATVDAINVCEGVFVQCAANETVTFTTTDPSSVTSTGNNNGMVNISVAQVVNSRDAQPSADIARIRINNGENLTKFVFNENNSHVYIPQDGNDYAVVRSEARGEMPVNFKAAENGTYTISVGAENLDVNYLHLIDNMTGTDVDLLATPSYTFEGKRTDYASRFKLVFSADNAEMDDDFAFISDGNIIILNEGEAALQVIDIMGRIVSTQTVNGNASVNNVGAAGVYVLQLINGNNVKTQKIVVR